MVHGTTGAPRDIARSPVPGQQPGGPPRGLARLAGVVCGRWSKFMVVGLWILIMAATSPFAGKLTGAEKNDASASRTSGITAADLATLSAVQGRVSKPLMSKDHTAIETVIGAGDRGLTSYVAGPVKIFKGIDSTLLYATLAVVVVLLLTYRSPILWLLPILSAGVALTAAEAVIYYLTQHANLTVNGQTDGILVVLVIGASTDYALLLIARYREELRRHENRHAAMAVALRRAGQAILASALTVVAGMLCLMAAESNDISGLGPVAAIGIVVGVIAMVTLLPAVLVIFGRWIFWPAGQAFGSSEPAARGLWSRVGAVIEPGPGTADMVAKLTVPRPRGERYRQARHLNWSGGE